MSTPPADVDAFFCNGLGDAVMALPALFALSEKLGPRLRVMTDNRLLQEIFAAPQGPAVAPLATVRDEATGRRQVCEQATNGHSGYSACALWMNTWLDAAFLRAVARSGRLVASAFEESHIRVSWDPTLHDFEKYFRFAELFEAGAIDAYFGWPSELCPARLVEHEIAARPTVILHLDTADAKMMSPADEAEMLAEVSASFPHVLFVVIGMSGLRSGLPQRAHNILETRRLPISTCVGLIAQARALIGYDSCFLHVADLTGVPAIGLLSSTSEKEFGVFRTTGLCLAIESGVESIARTMCAELRAFIRNDISWRTWRDARGQRYWSRLRRSEEAGRAT